MANGTNNAAKTMTRGWAQFNVWMRLGSGDDKRSLGICWANSPIDAAHRARVQHGPARYQVRTPDGRKILVGHA
jgi:hypothetical protein